MGTPLAPPLPSTLTNWQVQGGPTAAGPSGWKTKPIAAPTADQLTREGLVVQNGRSAWLDQLRGLVGCKKDSACTLRVAGPGGTADTSGPGNNTAIAVPYSSATAKTSSGDDTSTAVTVAPRAGLTTQDTNFTDTTPDKNITVTNN